jgi:hypothetical protein
VLTPPDALVNLLKPWADYYSHSKGAESVVTFLHIGGLLLAGGVAIAADRSTLRALRVASAERGGHLRELAAVHRWVLTGLTIIVLSGVALVASDIETFFGSWIYWLKMALVVLLLLNGVQMTRAESALAAGPDDHGPHWNRLRRSATTSLVLWFSITALGAALVNFS